MNKILLENTSIFDVSGIYKEQFYHGLILGLILKLKKLSENYYALASFYESDEHSKEIQEIYDYLLEKM